MITQHFFKNTPTNFALSYFGLYLDYIYPKGGTGVLVDKLSQSIRANGGEMLVNTKVVKVDHINKQIETSDGKVVHYEKLIWAADTKSLYHNIEALPN